MNMATAISTHRHELPEAMVAHVLLLPLPLQGPVNCFLNLAHLLSNHAQLKLTFVNAGFVHSRLPDLQSLLPHVDFCAFSDGIPGDCPRSSSQMAAMVGNLEAEVISRLPEFIEAPVPVTCVIADGIFRSAGRKAMELGIPVVYFSTMSPGCIWACCALIPRLVDDGYLPFQNGVNMDEPVTTIPGSETTLRRRDLPGACRSQDMSDPNVQLVVNEYRELPTAQGHILNSFDELEGTALLAEMRNNMFPNLYTIGPLHLHLQTRLPKPPSNPKTGSCSSFWREDRSCIDWLDAQPSETVLYVSFGSFVKLTVEEVIEFWHGLVNSGFRFLWVQRAGLMGDDDESEESWSLRVPKEILDATKERGCIVKWAPQGEVLAHRAIGGFLTHSGWNSTLESIVEGVPMLCWPCGVDQYVISRFVGEVWRIGVDMKDKCDRVVIENMVRDLMERRRDELFGKARELCRLAHEAVNKGGSSWCALDRLVEDIKLMRLKVPNC